MFKVGLMDWIMGNQTSKSIKLYTYFILGLYFLLRDTLKEQIYQSSQVAMIGITIYKHLKSKHQISLTFWLTKLLASQNIECDYLMLLIIFNIAS